VKEIKAYMRFEFLGSTIEQLEDAGARDITVIRADAVGPMADHEMDRWHVLRKYQERYSTIAKLEIVCRDDEATQFVEIIRQHGHTGESGDGRIFVSPVEQAVNIRTGAEGEDAL
jgi:nitrogen regulatory protein PII